MHREAMQYPSAEETVIEADGLRLYADIMSPPAPAHGLVLFAHGSGSGRFSPRNRSVARYLVKRELATVLLDLLTEDEDRVDQLTREYRFDVPRLAQRLVVVTDWLAGQSELGKLPLGYFGASTGAAAALIAAAERPERVAAVVSRGGRPDLAEAALPLVRAPTLLVVGGHDIPVIDLNRQAAEAMRAEVEIEIVPRATHLFEEPGALEQVCELAANWFLEHLHTTG